MEIDVEEKNRKVIPRWRDFRTTLALGELHSLKKPEVKELAETSLEEQIEDWETNRSLSFASDLIGAGLVLGKTSEVEEAAGFVLSNQSHATEIQRRVARRALDPFSPVNPGSDEIVANSGDEIVSHSRLLVKKYRNQLCSGMRNPVKLVDLAREYATLGSLKKALRTMNVAVALAPANRFVLRSATRLFVHAGEIDRAHEILKRAPNLRSDPWLLAAEIAVSSLRERTSDHIKFGLNQTGDNNRDSFDLSELTSAIATLEMESANVKLARKLFKRALRKPTENSVAQAEWASRSLSGWTVEVTRYDVPRKYEALARSQFMGGQFEAALDQAKNWIRDQPFAVSPVTFAGMVATVLENFSLGETIMRFGLRANPDNTTLRNNLAFALASNNQPERAESELSRIDRSSISTREQIVITATEGLIKFRKGLHGEGRLLYGRAIDLADENKEPSYVLRALVFLAREEIYAQTAFAKSALELADRQAKHLRLNPDLKVLFNRLNQVVDSNNRLRLGAIGQ